MSQYSLCLVVCSGPTLKFHSSCIVALTGADFDVSLDDAPVTWWSSFHITAGQLLRIGAVQSSTGVSLRSRISHTQVVAIVYVRQLNTPSTLLISFGSVSCSCLMVKL